MRQRLLRFLVLVFFALLLWTAYVAAQDTSPAVKTTPAKPDRGACDPKTDPTCFVGPRVLSSPEPNYSKQARKAKLQGKVVLRITVGVDGKAHDIRVIQSLGMGLDEEAIKAVSRWTFAPATRGGRPVPLGISVDVNFILFQ